MNGRIYGYGDVLMLLSCIYIADRCLEHEQQLVAHRPSWKAPYFADLRARIFTSFDENIGSDSLAKLKEATSKVNATLTLARRALMQLKQEIEVDFRKDPTRRDYLLNLLGFDNLKAKNPTQVAYTQALLAIQRNLTPDIQLELIAAGTNPAAIEHLGQYAQQLLDANALQESLKVGRKTTSHANVSALNAIYDEVISICKLASTYLVGNKELQESFIFLTALRANGYTHRSKRKPE
ncbi:hypothetical protein [Alistipes sp. ZOR0009]|uniref:hypothetical protein n=1 Tax=Alistipes sp. ZOR0009 TaxID=1339253 RepID=UPI000646E1CF|nr:hypothetical protein [Alistipes sp. ZOR0009]